MPPLLRLPVKTGISHGDLEQIQMRANRWVSTSVMAHCGGREMSKVGGHSDGAISRIDQCSIDSEPPAMQRASTNLRIGDIVIVMHGPPQLHLHRFRAIRIPDF